MAAERGSTHTLAVLGLVLGVLSLLVLHFLFGPAAIVCGTIAGSRGSLLGWVGAALGAVAVVGCALLMVVALDQ